MLSFLWTVWCLWVGICPGCERPLAQCRHYGSGRPAGGLTVGYDRQQQMYQPLSDAELRTCLLSLWSGYFGSHAGTWDRADARDAIRDVWAVLCDRGLERLYAETRDEVRERVRAERAKR